MPQRGNGGVPTEREVRRYLTDTRRNAELRQKVLAELRERSGMEASLLVNSVIAGIAILAVFATVAAAATSALAVNDAGAGADAAIGVYTSLGRTAVAIFVIGIGAAIVRQGRSRHASSWLAAYEEAERRPWWRRAS